MQEKKELILKVDRFIESNRDASISMLQKMLGFRTIVGTSYRGIQEYIGERLRSLGMDIDLWEPRMSDYSDFPWFDAPPDYYPDGFRDKPVLVGTWNGKGDRSLIINGHVDVVSPEPLSSWQSDPWEGVVRDGRIFGRGVIDTKGGLAAGMVALDALKKNGFVPNGRIHFMSAIDQEVNGAGTIAAMKRGYRADVALIVEPTNFEIGLATTGAFWFKVIVRGKPSHAAAAWEGVNAADKAMIIHQGIMKKLAHRSELRHPLYAEYSIPAPINLGTFISGGYPSSVPDEARLEYRLGVLPGETNEKVISELREAVTKTASGDPWLQENMPEMHTFGWYGNPTEIEKEHPFVRILQSNYHSVRGREPRLLGMTYGCDAGRLWTIAKIKSVVFAPGDLWAHAHKLNEFLKVDDFIQYTKILARSIIDWFGA